MKPAPFAYVTASSTADAVNHLSAPGREVKVLAGGQSLIPVLNMRMARPDVLVDITRIPELRRIEITPSGQLRIGAAVRQVEVLEDRRVQEGWPVVTAAIAHIGHPQIRASGTVCGSLTHADSSAELPAVAVLLGAVIEVQGPQGTREVDAADFFVGTFTTTLEPEELVTAVRFPSPEPGRGHDVMEFTQRRGDFATVGVATSTGPGGERPAEPRAVFFGVGSGPERVPAVEKYLGATAPDELDEDEIARILGEALAPPADVHATSQLRLELATTVLHRSFQRAREACR